MVQSKSIIGEQPGASARPQQADLEASNARPLHCCASASRCNGLISAAGESRIQRQAPVAREHPLSGLYASTGRRGAGAINRSLRRTSAAAMKQKAEQCEPPEAPVFYPWGALTNPKAAASTCVERPWHKECGADFGVDLARGAPSLRRETAISFSWSRIPRRSRFTAFRLWRDLPSTAAFLCVRNARCTCGRSATLPAVPT
jgi:hypothetical protein